MVVPSREHFRTLARSHRVVPVCETLLADLTTPLAAFARLCGPDEGRTMRARTARRTGRTGFLLESVDHGGRWSRWSFIGRDPRARLVARGTRVTLTGEVPDGIPTDRGVLAALEALLGHYRSPTPEQFGADLPPLHSGVVGYLGYDVVREVERLPDVPEDDKGWPDAVLSVIGELAAYDHWSQQVTLVANAFVEPDATDAELDAAYDDAVARLERMAADGATPLDEPLVTPPERADESVAVESSMAAGMYEAAVTAAKEHILAGDIFQVVLAQRFGFSTTADPFDVYRTLRQVNPSPYMYFVREDELTLVGCSPEPMVQLLDGRVISRPIAGTRFRGRTDEHDRQLAAELLEHPKERAEHIMLVDLARNDVGRVVEFGTVPGGRADDAGALQPRHAPHVAGVGPAGRGPHPDRRAAGHPAGGHRVRGTQGAGHGDHRRDGAHQAGALRRDRRLHRLLRQHRHRHRHPHHGHGARRSRRHPAGHRPGRCRRGGRLRARGRGAGDPQQGQGAAVGGARGGAHDGTTAGRAGRPGHMTDVTADYLALRREVAAFPFPRDVLSVQGADAVSFLQGQLSADVAALAVGSSAWSLLLEPQGKVDAWIRVTRTAGDRVVIDVDGGWGERGGGAAQPVQAAGGRRPSNRSTGPAWRCAARAFLALDVSGAGAELVLEVDWRGLPGVDLLGPDVTVPDGVHRAGEVAVHNVRIEQGWPAMGHELDDSVIPAEAGQWLIDRSVSFTKGCYTGQELVARIDSRGGNTPRHLRGVVIGANVLPPEGATVQVDGQDKGTLTSVGESLDLRAPVALAYVHRTVEVPAEVTVAWDGGEAPARVVDLPFLPA